LSQSTIKNNVSNPSQQERVLAEGALGTRLKLTNQKQIKPISFQIQALAE
jgi:hypothetical protein